MLSLGKREAKLTEIERTERPRQVVLQVPEARLGVIIGKNGCMIKRLQAEAEELRCSLRVLSKRAVVIISGDRGQDVEVRGSLLWLCISLH